VAWSEKEVLRVFALSQIAGGKVHELREALSLHSPPTSPVWAPKLQFDDTSIEIAVNAKVDALISAAPPPSLIVLSAELWTSVEAAKQIGPGDGARFEQIMIRDFTKESAGALAEWINILAHPTSK